MKPRLSRPLFLSLWLSLWLAGHSALAADNREIELFHPPISNVSVKMDILFDLFRLLEKDLSVRFRMTDLPWKRAIQMAERGAGGIIPFSKNVERLQRFDFSDEIFRDEIVLVVLRGKEFPFQKIDDLRGKTIGFLGGATVGEEFERGIREVFSPSPDFAGPEARLKKLLAGRIDAAVVSTGAAGLRSIIAQDSELIRNKDRFVILPRPLASDANYLAFAKTADMQPFLNNFNNALQVARKDGRLQRIMDRHSAITSIP